MSSFGILVFMLGGIFWLFRIVVALMYTAEAAFMIQPLNITWEIALLFVTLACFILLVVKRSLVGALIYFIAYACYFGVDLYQGLMNIGEGGVRTGTILATVYLIDSNGNSTFSIF